MSYEFLIYQKLEGAVALLTLNRPHKVNALSRQAKEELRRAVEEVASDKDVRVMVLTGAPRPDGRPCFSSGSDIRESAEGPQVADAPSLGSVYQHLVDPNYHEANNVFAAICSRIESMAKVSIAAIDGVCTAGGLEIALACDIRVVSETAEVSDLHIKNTGSLGGSGLMARLPRTMGRAWAKEIMFTADVFNGREAVAMGFANHVYAPDKLLEGALILARKIARMRPEAVALAKALINTSGDHGANALHYDYMGTAALSSEGGEWASRRK